MSVNRRTLNHFIDDEAMESDSEGEDFQGKEETVEDPDREGDDGTVTIDEDEVIRKFRTYTISDFSAVKIPSD